MTPKLLSPEELEVCRKRASTSLKVHELVATSNAMLGHISALEMQASNARASEEVWRRRLNAAADALADVRPGEVGRLDLLSRIAALLDDLNDLRGTIALCAGHLKVGGNKYEVAALLRSVLDKTKPNGGHPGAKVMAALLEEHNKALVRARNEGLEKAADMAHVNWEDGDAKAAAIRTMKEPEE